MYLLADCGDIIALTPEGLEGGYGFNVFMYDNPSGTSTYNYMGCFKYDSKPKTIPSGVNLIKLTVGLNDIQDMTPYLGTVDSKVNVCRNTLINFFDISNDVKYIKPNLLKYNLIDYSTLTKNRYTHYGTGDIYTDSKVFLTDYIDVSNIESIVYSRRTLLTSESVSGMCFYDENRAYVSGKKDILGSDKRGYLPYKIDVPTGAKYLRIILWSEDILSLRESYVFDSKYYESTGSIDRSVNCMTTVVEERLAIPPSSIIRQWIDTSEVIGSLVPDSPRLLVIPLAGVYSLDVDIGVNSTKRYGFCNSLESGSLVFQYNQITGRLNDVFINEGYKYFIVQLFINSDVEQDINEYLKTSKIIVSCNQDIYSRFKIDNLTKDKFFYSEQLKGLPILNSFSDIYVDTDSFSNCGLYHSLMNQVCTNSNGFITRTTLGQDGHGNNLYKYETNPKTLIYSAKRSEYAPVYPIQGYKRVRPVVILLTSNIHGRERNGNWIVYNLFNKIISENSQMMSFFKHRVKIVAVPYICATGTYSNSDGININRDFPTTYDGTCVSNEASLVKSVIDEYGNDIFLHIDIHTFNAGSGTDGNVAGWIFTDDDMLGQRCVISSEYVLDMYNKKYPEISRFGYDYVGSTNIPTTCTYYTQQVYGSHTATMEGALTVDGSPAGADEHTSAVAYLYDIVTQTICSMID